jgi:signal transduction histidine kinase
MPALKGVRVPLLWLAIWFAAVAAVVLGVVFVERARDANQLVAEAATLHRLASQRADQHDAHLTNLSAVASAGTAPRHDLFLEVAATIRRFYPRIEAIDLIPFDTGAGAADAITTRRSLPDETARAIRSAALRSDGAIAVLASPDPEGRYLLVKRSPNSDAARFALALQIDAAGLLESDTPFWRRAGAAAALFMPGGEQLLGRIGPSGLPAAASAAPLGSGSQPLVLKTAFVPSWADLLPVRTVATGIAAVTLLLAVGAALLRLMARTRQAERQARLSAQETRLAHAQRVNLLGEMASGMAHELTQPLTAILSQSQAGLRLLERDGGALAVKPILHDTVEQARRASGILDRLRSWSRPERDAAVVTPLNAVAESVKALALPEARSQGVALDLSLDALDPTVTANAVELEQVVFNLVRNAIEALKHSTVAERRVAIVTRVLGDRAILDVADSGPGVAAAIRPHLFEPFVTGKPGGTGLGLALASRLVERMDGEIALIEGAASGATFRISLPLAGPRAKTETAA